MEAYGVGPDSFESLQHLPTASSRSHVLVLTRDGGSSDAARSSVHTPLRDPASEIRLLRALNKGVDDPLTYELRTVKFNPRHVFQAYYAISYTWGHNEDPRTITINGHDFVVSQNCYYALWQARLHYKNCSIWIDVICINQTDLSEKSAQVAIVGEIYRQASCVLACVGPHADDSELVKAWAEHPDTVTEKWHEYEIARLTFPHKSLYEKFRYGDVVRNRQRTVLAVLKFSHRTYWRRLWIVQEIQVGLSRKVLCGDHLISWEHVLKLRETIRSEDVWDSRASWQWHAGRSVQNGCLVLVENSFPATPLSLQQLLRKYRHFECEDPRDRIYGLLSLAQKYYREDLAPDYSITEFKLALKVARLIGLADVPNLLDALNLSCRSDEHRLWLQGQTNNYRVCERDTATTIDDTIMHYKFDSEEHIFRLLDKQINIDLTYDTHHGLVLCKYLRSLLHDWDAALRDFPALLNVQCMGDVTQTVGLISKEAHAGDLMVEYYPGLILVLRRNRGEIYDIIGQGYVIGRLKRFKTKDIQRTIEIRLSVGEAVALSALGHPGPEQKPESELFRDHIERFRYPVTARPRGAARVTFR